MSTVIDLLVALCPTVPTFFSLTVRKGERLFLPASEKKAGMAGYEHRYVSIVSMVRGYH